MDDSARIILLAGHYYAGAGAGTTGTSRQVSIYGARYLTFATLYIGVDGELPIDNNWIENRILPVALGKSNWLFAGSDRAGRRTAVVMILIQTAKLHGLDPYAYPRDVLERLPLTTDSRIGELLPGA